MSNLAGSRNFLDAFEKEFGRGREEFARAWRDHREYQGKSENAPRASEMLGTHNTLIRAAENLNIANEDAMQLRDDRGIGFEPKGKGRRTGQMVGAAVSDIVNDTTRGVYWLLNAPQATANVIAESSFGRAKPELFATTSKFGEDGRVIYTSDEKGALDEGLVKMGEVSGEPVLQPGVRKHGSGKDQHYIKRNYEPSHVYSLLAPTGFAINYGLGLYTPFGGAPGYEAAVPDPEDKSKTSNVIAEVGAKYLMSRTGNLLPYDEFKEARPDVSKGEYNAYKAFKWDKNADINPFDDGKFTLPTGIVKGTTEGIHGPEVQFLGKGIPLTTTGIPFATALAGGIAGVRRDRPIRGGMIGGIAGLVGGQVLGAAIENERRNRNMRENTMKTMPIDPEGAVNNY